MNILEKIFDLLGNYVVHRKPFEESWFMEIDKQVLADICGVKKISIKDVSRKGQTYEDDSINGYSYVDEETGKHIFMARRFDINFGLNLRNHVYSRKDAKIKTVDFEVPALKNCVYYEAHGSRYLLLLGNSALEIICENKGLSKEQLSRIGQHFADKKVF